MNPRLARILVDGTTDREFDYTVPDALVDGVQVGSRVRLPFRHRQLLGTVSPKKMVYAKNLGCRR